MSNTPKTQQQPATTPSPKSASSQAAPKWLGKRLGRFCLQALIGQGAMGRVFRADDTTLQRRVALKIIALYDRNGQINPHAERFINEARAAAALEHPHVVQIYEAGDAGKVCYIAMELVEGGSLAELVDASGPLDVHRACQLTAEAAEALAAAHAVGIIHRDVKPANLMLSRHGRCKVTDFGLAMIDDDITDSAIIQRNRRVGTALFVAPEVIRGTCADELSDMYSLGATLFYLLTGRPPFIANGRTDTMRAHLEQPVPDVRAFRPTIPAGLAEALARALDKDPGRRFASMEQFSKLLRVYTIPIAGATQAPAAPPKNYAPTPSQFSHPSDAGISGSMGAGLTGSFASSSALSGLGSAGAIRSFNTNESPQSSTSLPRMTAPPTNRITSLDHLTALAEAAASVDHLAALAQAAASGELPQNYAANYYPNPSQQIPTATVVYQRQNILGLPLPTFIGIAAGLLIAATAVTWALLHASTPEKNIPVAVSPQPTAPEPLLAADREEPAPTIAATTPLPQPTPPAKVVVPPTPIAIATVAPQSTPATPTTSDQVFQATDIPTLKLIAAGNDPNHPNKWAVVQGKVLYAARSASGKTFYLRFQEVNGPPVFEVIFSQGSTDIFKQLDTAYGGDAAIYLRGETVRISGKLRITGGVTVQMLPATIDQLKVVNNP